MNILVVYPWDIDSLVLQNNGAGRRVGSLVNFLREKGHSLEVLSFGYRSSELMQDGIIYRQVKAPKGLFWLGYWGLSFLLGRLMILQVKLWSTFAFYEHCGLVQQTLQKTALNKDAIFVEYPFAFGPLKEFSEKIILTNHDVQSRSWSAGRRLSFEALEKRLLTKEVSALNGCRFAVLVSKEDGDFFKKYLKRPIFVIENPLVLPSSFSGVSSQNLRGCLFVGSGWFPNLEAVKFINEKIAPRCPEVRFTIIGSCCNAIRIPARNVTTLGVVDETSLELEYSRHSVALMPLYQGTGMSLKTLEALGRGLTVVSTGLGVRGLPFVDGVHGLLAHEPDEFANAIKLLCSDPQLGKMLSRAGMDLAQKYNCRNLYKGYVQMLKEIELA